MLDYELIFSNTLTYSNGVHEKMWVVLYNMISGPMCVIKNKRYHLGDWELGDHKFFYLSFFRPRSSVSRALDCDTRGAGSAPKNTKKKYQKNQMWGIFIYGFSEPLGIKYEGLVCILHRSELFVKFQFGVVCCFSLSVTKFWGPWNHPHNYHKVNFDVLFLNFT